MTCKYYQKKYIEYKFIIVRTYNWNIKTKRLNAVEHPMNNV